MNVGSRIRHGLEFATEVSKNDIEANELELGVDTKVESG